MRIEFKGKLDSLSITAAETLNSNLIIVEFGLHRRQSWVVGGRDPPDFGSGGRGGRRGVVDGS